MKAVVRVVCTCGRSETVTEGRNGQTLGGTAGDLGARHEDRCGGEVEFDWSVRGGSA